MARQTRRIATFGAAAFTLAGFAAIAAPATAGAAEPIVAGSCGSTVTGKVGQPMELRLPLLAPINLGTVQEGTHTLSRTVPVVGGVVDSLCNVTVTGINTVAAPVQDVARPVAETARKVVEDVVPAAKPAPAPQKPPGNEPAPQKPAPQPGLTPQPGATPPNAGHPGLEPPNSPVLGGGAGKPSLSPLRSTFSPESSWTHGLSTSADGLFSPAAGLRYGGQLPGYAPEFGVIGQYPTQNDAAPGGGSNGPQNVGQAQAIPQVGPSSGDGFGVPVLIAGLTLAGVSAALVRTWVLRHG